MRRDIQPQTYNLVVPANNNLTFVNRYLQAISAKVPLEDLLSFFSPDAVVEELPNRLKPNGYRSGVTEMKSAYERGRQIMAWQRYDVRSALAEGDVVAIELVWTGQLAVAVGHLQPGAEMRAQCAMFFKFRDGKILSQRNYDCYDPF